MIRSSGIMKEVIHILNDKAHYDAKTRGYMAMALGRFRDPEAENALIQALQEVGEEEEAELPIFLMWSIGSSENPNSAKEVARFLNHKNGDLRKTAAYVLGVLGNRSFVPQLERLLEDSANDVQWNAALSLARLGSEKGSAVLTQMLDRDQLRTRGLNDSQIEPVMVNAAKGFMLIRSSEIIPLLESISKGDPSLKVRQAALAALAHQKES